MAPGFVVASPCCCPAALSTSFSERMTCHARPWNSRVAFPIIKSSARSRDLLFPDEMSFWGTVLQEQRGALAEEDVQRRGGRKVVLSATSSQPKPPIFKLKKPLRVPVDTTGNGIVAPKTEVFEVGEDGDGRFTVKENHKSGYVALIGNPNVGKSTLLNQIIGQRLSIVTDKPQTTRHRILGICSSPEYQIILYDTPGVLPKTERRLDEKMMQNVTSARMNSDCVLVVVDACRDPEKSMEVLGEGLQLHHERQQPTLIVLNKMDLIKPGEIAKKSEWYQAHCNVDAVIPVSAKFGKGIDRLKAWIVDQLPKGPAYYPKDIVSEHSERFFVSEIVREKIFMQYRKEIPYVSQVNVMQYIERKEPAKDFIEAEIVVERASQMGILIGKDGGALKLLATASRLDIEEFVGKQVYLELKVKVKGSWREDEELLDSYGYNKGKIRT